MSSVELKVQSYLRSGKSLQDLERDFAIASSAPRNGKISLNYDMIESPMGETIVKECRGIILRLDTWDVVACPFFKFFNAQEGPAAKIDWSSAKYLEKMDGSLLILYWDCVTANWYFATRSMPEAEGMCNALTCSFADLAQMALKEMDIDFAKWTEKLNKRYTYMFELTSPYNRVVVDYKKPQLTLIGVRDLDTLKELDAKPVANEIGVPHPMEFGFATLDDIIAVVNEWNAVEHEGVVVVDKHFNRVKVKGINYVAFHGAISSINASDRNLMRLIMRGADDDLAPIMSDFLKEKTEKFKARYASLIKQFQNEWETVKHIKEPKEFADKVSHMTWPAVMFGIFRGHAKDIRAFVHKAAEKTNNVDRILTFIGVKGAEALDCIPKEIREKLPSEVPCESVFEYLREKHPDFLLRVAKSNKLSNADLSEAAEHLGHLEQSFEIQDFLMKLLQNQDASVREGAIYGLSHYMESKEVRKAMQHVASKDSSKAVRQAATDLLI